jgi:hypothetical protein
LPAPIVPAPAGNQFPTDQLNTLVEVAPSEGDVMSRVIRFPLERRRPDAMPFSIPSCESDLRYEPQRLCDESNANVLSQALAKIAEARADGLSSLPDMAWIISTAMPLLKRRGKAWSSLPRLHRDLLEKHAEAGDPTAETFKAWIEGKHIPSAEADWEERRDEA